MDHIILDSQAQKALSEPSIENEDYARTWARIYGTESVRRRMLMLSFST